MKFENTGKKPNRYSKYGDKENDRGGKPQARRMSEESQQSYRRNKEQPAEGGFNRSRDSFKRKEQPKENNVQLFLSPRMLDLAAEMAYEAHMPVRTYLTEALRYIILAHGKRLGKTDKYVSEFKNESRKGISTWKADSEKPKEAIVEKPEFTPLKKEEDETCDDFIQKLRQRSGTAGGDQDDDAPREERKRYGAGRPSGDRPRRFGHDSGFKSGDNRAGDRRTGDYRAGDKRTGGYGAGDKRTGGYGAGDKRTGGYGAGDKRTGGYGAGDKRTGGYGAGDKRTGGYGAGDKRTGGYRAGDKRTGGYGAGDKRTGDFRAGDKKVGDKRVGNSSGRGPRSFSGDKKGGKPFAGNRNSDNKKGRGR